MTPEELVAAACPKIGVQGWAFYFVPETSAVGDELGLDAFRFYFLGRGGVLGDVEPSVVTSAFGYFNPSLVAHLWNTGREKVDPRTAGRAYHQCAADFGRSRFADLDLAAFCEAAGAVNDAADDTGLALYAGIRTEPLADDAPGRAQQLVTVLRELRGSAHLLSIVATGLDPKKAHYISRPNDMAMFGYQADDAPEVSDADRLAKDEAETMTDRIVTPAYSVLDESGCKALLDGLAVMEAAVAATA